ncbi:MAG: D-tyrosyl-tRNA(Tyr) deacylase [Ignavibacteriales bacterium]|nr:D-tyrosyl-tRNA(Tyr) deacylase [Ignavibacteriales bacterium]
MRVLIQRVKQSSVDVDGGMIGAIGRGILILLGVKHNDTEEEARYLASRCSNLRIFEDNGDKMNLSVKDIQGEALVISQFTLYGDTTRGNRPSYSTAAQPGLAESLYDKFVYHLRNELGEDKVKTGKFRAMMNVHLINDGPVTVMIESK